VELKQESYLLWGLWATLVLTALLAVSQSLGGLPADARRAPEDGQRDARAHRHPPARAPRLLGAALRPLDARGHHRGARGVWGHPRGVLPLSRRRARQLERAPEVPARDGAEGAPALAERGELLWGRQLGLAVGATSIMDAPWRPRRCLTILGAPEGYREFTRKHLDEMKLVNLKVRSKGEDLR
jgi:hypothetical protein